MREVGKSGYIGVTFIGQRHNKYLANVRHEGHLYNLGHYETPETAARVRDVAALILQGPDARLNFDGEPPDGISRQAIQQRIADIEQRRNEG